MTTTELPAIDNTLVAAANWRVLLVEDNVIASRVAQWILQDLHCSVDVANHPQQALQLVKANRYQAIFMDIGLPEMDGFQLTELINRAMAETRVPIVALSAHTDIAEQQPYFDLGMSAAIVKPLTREKAASVLVALGLSQAAKPVEEEGQGSAQGLPKMESLAVIDLSLLKKYISADPSVYQPLLKDFLASLADCQLRLSQAFADADWQAFSACTHKLNGAAGYYGAQQLQAICSQLQHLPVDISLDYVEPRFKQLQQALANLLAYQS